MLVNHWYMMDDVVPVNFLRDRLYLWLLLWLLQLLWLLLFFIPWSVMNDYYWRLLRRFWHLPGSEDSPVYIVDWLFDFNFNLYDLRFRLWPGLLLNLWCFLLQMVHIHH